MGNWLWEIKWSFIWQCNFSFQNYSRFILEVIKHLNPFSLSTVVQHNLRFQFKAGLSLEFFKRVQGCTVKTDSERLLMAIGMCWNNKVSFKGTTLYQNWSENLWYWEMIRIEFAIIWLKIPTLCSDHLLLRVGSFHGETSVTWCYRPDHTSLRRVTLTTLFHQWPYKLNHCPKPRTNRKLTNDYNYLDWIICLCTILGKGVYWRHSVLQTENKNKVEPS